MKKLLAIMLIFTMLFPMMALAEKDPIVGTWYLLYDFELYPEMKANFGNYDFMLIQLTFLENGSIILGDYYMTEGAPGCEAQASGRWSNENGKYSYSVIGLGEGEATVSGEDMYLKSQDNIKTLLHKAIPFNPYKDYVFN